MLFRSQVLRHHRALAVRWNGDHSDLIPIEPEAFGIGLAVDTRDGLLVPVIRNVLKSSLEEITGESQRLIERAREGALVRDEMEGGVITLTNLGGYGIDAFTPIINYPEVAILGIGSIRREPVYTDGERIEPRDRMTLSLTFDHAALDGAPAAAFLRDIVAAIRDPSFG